VARESEGATIKGFATEVEKGQRFYEASLVVNGHTKDILIDKNGTIVEVEEASFARFATRSGSGCA
jgi:hypothetical protein